MASRRRPRDLIVHGPSHINPASLTEKRPKVSVRAQRYSRIENSQIWASGCVIAGGQGYGPTDYTRSAEARWTLSQLHLTASVTMQHPVSPDSIRAQGDVVQRHADCRPLPAADERVVSGRGSARGSA